jgi:hypothetical protein
MKLNKDFCYTFGIIVAICLGLFAFLRKEREGLLGLKKQNNDNSPPWKIEVDEDTKNLQFIYQGHLTGDGKRIVALKLSKDGNLTVHRGITFEQPVEGSWQISPDKNNSLVFANKAGGGIKLISTGTILPIKHTKGGPIDYSKLCMKNDGTGKIYSGGCEK